MEKKICKWSCNIKGALQIRGLVKILYILLILAVFSNEVYAQDGNPFTKIDYDSIVIYDFEGNGEGGDQSSIINKKNKLNSTIKKRQTLTNSENKSLVNIVGLKSSYGEYPAACFEPHLGIVFYKKGKPVQYITICMDCNRLLSSIDIPGQQQGKEVAEDGTTYYRLIGMSDGMRKHLNQLLKKYEFSHQRE